MKQKRHIELCNVDSIDWSTCNEFTTNIKQKVLCTDFDQKNKTGSRSRLLKFEPRSKSGKLVAHDYWQEMILLSGELIIDKKAYSNMYFMCRPPGIYHGPYESKKGCLMYELCYYKDDNSF